MADDNEFEQIKDLVDPLELLIISDYERHHYDFTIDNKKGIPMYEEFYESLSYEEPSDASDVSSYDQMRKARRNAYIPRRIVAPPENPFVYYRLRKNQTCEHCYCKGKNCHNIHYRPFLSACIARFHRKYPDNYNEHDAAKLFLDNYRVLAEFGENLDTNKIPGESEKVALPECIIFDSLAFALNSVEWTIMWELHELTIEDCKEEELKNVKCATASKKEK